MGSHTAFFYGTLMAPQVLQRVCHGAAGPDNALRTTHALRAQPAILHGHQRHRVRHADYPAIVARAGASVRGTLVAGLSDADMWRLDIFEGSEYRRAAVRVRVLVAAGSDEASGAGNVESGDEVEAETYVWQAGEAALEAREWDFAEFQREKMRFWVGAEGEGEYAEVDDAVAAHGHDGTRGRGANGHITQALAQEHKKDTILKNAV